MVPPFMVPLTILHTEASRGWGGQELRIQAEIAEMRRRGHRVLLAAAPDSELAKRQRGTDDPVIELPFRSKFHLGSIIGLRNLVLREKVQVLNTHSSIDSWNGAIATRGLRDVVLVRTRHLSIPVHRNWPTKWLYTRPQAVVTTGEALRQQLIDDNGIDSSRLLSIATGVDLGRFQPGTPTDRAAVRHEFSVANDEPLVGMIAMMRPMKGHAVLVAALPAIVAAVPKVRFLIVGDALDDNPMPRQLKEEVARMGFTERVRFAGLRSDVPRILAGLDLKVLPSVCDEGVPQSLSQAMASGVPVVSTQVGAIGELIEDGVTGRIVLPHAPDRLAQAVIAQLTDRESAKRMADAAAQRVRTLYSVPVMAARTEALYRRLLAHVPAWPEPADAATV